MLSSSDNTTALSPSLLLILSAGTSSARQLHATKIANTKEYSFFFIIDIWIKLFIIRQNDSFPTEIRIMNHHGSDKHLFATMRYKPL